MSANNNDDGDQSNPSTPDTVPAQTPAYDFQWDANKALANLLKHGVSFVLASSVIQDPLSLTIYDDEHSDDEDRWVTIGTASNGQTMVVVHTSNYPQPNLIRTRIISARPADRDEINNYQNTPH
jgi:uncharacterized protein